MKKIYLSIILIFVFVKTTFAQNIPSYVPVNGLLGWWSLSGNAIDSSGNGYNGVNMGATASSDRFGNLDGCLYFDNDYVEVLNLPLNFQTDFTFSFWQKLNSYSHAKVIVDMNQNAICNGTPHIWQYSDSVRLGMCSTAVGSLSLGGQANLLNNWVNFTFTSSSGVINMYKNGMLYFTMFNIWPATPISQFTLANGGNTSAILHGEPSNIFLDDVGLWTRVLTQNEITDLYNSGTTGIDEAQPANQIVIFPTVCNNSLNIITTSPQKNSTYLITDMLGNEILNGKINKENSIINISKLPEGCYIIVIDSWFKSKFIVSNK